MKSPITDKLMIRMKERRSIEFRKETFEIEYHFYKCTDSGEKFTTTELDEINLDKVYKQYNESHNIK